MNQLPPQVAESLREFHQIAAGAPLWPGFHPERTPLVLHGRDAAILVGHPDPPDGYTALAPFLGRPVYVGRPAPEMMANTATVIRGALCALAELPGQSQDPPRYARLLLHECFHVFQQQSLRALPQPDPRFLTLYPENDAENNALSIIENRLLAAALRGDSGAPARFLAVRELRQRRFGEGLCVYEARQEYNEGTPTYIEMQAGMPLPELTGLLENCNCGGRWAGNRRFYFTGAAIALLLDRLAPGWQERFARGGTTLQQLLREAVGDNLPPAESVLLGEGHAAVLDAERQGEEARRREIGALLAGLESGPGCRVEISIVAAPGCGWDPSRVTVVRPGIRLHTRWFAAIGQEIRVEIEGICLEDRERQVAVVRLPEPPVVTSERPFQFEGMGLKGSAPAGRLAQTPLGWEIRLGPS